MPRSSGCRSCERRRSSSPVRRTGATRTTWSTRCSSAMSSPRTGRMGDVVATIQAEQDRVIRRPKPGVLVVQGAPGTGKTAVALHRAAYLLYAEHLSFREQAILFVGPNDTFLRYVEEVVPSLGEDRVVLVTPADLWPAVAVDREEAAAVVPVK